jgi:predicted signal transduction protein with EAL and GGDEF domain
VRLGHRLAAAVRPGDTVARLGGDEFAIVQRHAAPATASELASKIIAELVDPFDVQGHQLIIGTSIGIAMAPADGREPDQLLRNADMALYRAKSDGRGTYHFFQPEMDAQMQERRKLELDLRKALQGDEFELSYQPLIDLTLGEACGFEALSVVSALGQSGLAASRLELEITESVLLQADRTVLDALHQFRDLGVRICMDDFGTGYSSLSYLRSFPFDKIKVDRSFIRELSKDNDCMAIIRAVMRLGFSLGMITTAEGVETEEQLDILRAEGCMQVQGFLFSQAVPAAEIPALLRRLRPRIRAA